MQSIYISLRRVAASQPALHQTGLALHRLLGCGANDGPMLSPLPFFACLLAPLAHTMIRNLADGRHEGRWLSAQGVRRGARRGAPGYGGRQEGLVGLSAGNGGCCCGGEISPAPNTCEACADAC